VFIVIIKTSKSVDEQNKLEISIIIPFYKEEANIEPFLLRTESVMFKMGISYEIIFALDPTPDIIRVRMWSKSHSIGWQIFCLASIWFDLIYFSARCRIIVSMC
jgi:hypothetical protein